MTPNSIFLPPKVTQEGYYPLAGDDYLFPGRSDGHISEDSAARILRGACKQAGVIGVSTHSFRRTALTQMSNAGIPLRVIQEISGHRNLEQLQRYLEVSDEQVLGAAASLAMLSPVSSNAVELDTNQKFEITGNSPR
ncbi:tyrosine-type recombinase/integrase [Nostoc sp. FACHB-973]|nr:tyrosine-type recombinase/integrase [Nostoc sp. FACHB-973]